MAKPELRAAARELRKAGCTYDEIAEQLGVSKSSVSLWVRDVPYVPNPRRQARERAHVKAMADARWSRYRAERDTRRGQVRTQAAASVTGLSREELIRLGAGVVGGPDRGAAGELHAHHTEAAQPAHGSQRTPGSRTWVVSSSESASCGSCTG